MHTTLVIHILAGTAGLAAGYLALFARKGDGVHRMAGTVFVWSMLAMCGAGLLITLVRNVAIHINVPASVLTAALVVTSLTTMRERSTSTRIADAVATIAMMALTLACFAMASAAMAGVHPYSHYAFPYVMFGLAGLIASIGDVRLWTLGPPVGRHRLARHLWRMCFALFIAALSFFLGQASVIPEPIRFMPALVAAPLIVLVTMIYWLIRVLRKGRRTPHAVRPDPGVAGGLLID